MKFHKRIQTSSSSSYSSFVLDKILIHEDENENEDEDEYSTFDVGCSSVSISIRLAVFLARGSARVKLHLFRQKLVQICRFDSRG